MNTLNVDIMQDAVIGAQLSCSQPFVHVAIASALRDLGTEAYVHRYKVSLQDESGKWFDTPGLAVEYNGNILSLEAGEGWAAIEEYEKDFNTILFKEWSNTQPTSALFEHEKISEELFEKMRKKVQVESASMFAVLSEMIEKKMLTISQKEAKVRTP